MAKPLVPESACNYMLWRGLTTCVLGRDLSLDPIQLEFLMKGKVPTATDSLVAAVPAISDKVPITRGQRELMAQLCTLADFAPVIKHINSNAAEWTKFIEGPCFPSPCCKR